ncbi:MAG: tRNA (adenosine(37)-N6)-threonylcarbamoyltransferase complex ATPase subunit type 1 TsaE [Candidatus Rokuibacteriota bacterium]|nr:MAG: tRNA (adenosine(37)-N6)-threonylcarbamoyltransferase complex ATPase subunit type 1 TsaE [Candidatus Rokubacteria bacterium]
MTATTTIVSASPEDTEVAGERLGRTLGPGDVVALTGELGAGKTCFVQGIARGVGVTTRPTSPTFVLINEYRGRLPVHHVDAYRTNSVTELADLGLEEMIDGDAVTVIEWAEKAGPLLPKRTIHVHIEGVGDEPRTIRIEPGVSTSRH